MSAPVKAEPLWNAYEAAAATGGRLVRRGSAGMEEGRGFADQWIATGISFDTRTLAPGDLFVALIGERDGHDFLDRAAAAGAAAAVVSKLPDDAPEGLPLLVVPDTLRALEDLGAAARDRFFGKIVAVTGSAGKTSTKEMLRAALGAHGAVHAAVRSFNNHLGVPASLASLPSTSDFGVFEIGMNHAGEITPLTALVRPHGAIITTVAAAHLENFDSLDGIAAAKAEILSGIRVGGSAVLPADNPYYGFLKAEAEREGVARVMAFGGAADAAQGVRLVAYEQLGSGGLLRADAGGRAVTVRLQVPGAHHASNACAVLAAGLALDLPLDPLVTGLEGFSAGEGRGARHEVSFGDRRVTVLDESYNANPASMRAALAVLAAEPAQGPGARRIAVLGEMKELGPTAPALHRALLGPIEEAGVTALFLAGEGMVPLAEAAKAKGGLDLMYAPTAEALLAPLTSALNDGDTILFKGSNASRVGAVLRAFLAKAAEAR